MDAKWELLYMADWIYRLLYSILDTTVYQALQSTYETSLTPISERKKMINGGSLHWKF